jgi:predicted PurR-regulated permease PerM
VSEDGPEEGARQAAEAAERAATAADHAAHHGAVAAETAEGARDAADRARSDAANHRDGAEAAAETATDAREATDEARAEAAGHQALAADAQKAADSARGEAAEHRDGAADAAETAEVARDQATVARDGAERASETAELARARASAVAEAVQGISDLPAGDPVLDPEVRAEEAGVDAANPLGRPGLPLNRRSPFRIGFAGALGVGAAYLLYQAIVSAKSVLVLVIVAAFLAIGLNPVVSRLERTGMRRGMAVGIVFLGVVAFFVLFGYAVLPPVVTQIANFVEALPGYIRDLGDNPTIKDLDGRFGIINRAQTYVTGDLGPQIAANALTVTQRVAGLVLKGLTILILTLYFLSSFNSIKQTAYRLVPRTRRARVSLIGDEILSRVGGYVAGAVVVALIAGVSSLVWVSALGIPYPLALALIVTFTDIIPLIGATIGAVVVTAVAFFVSLPVGIATGIFFLVYQQVENYLVYPRVMSRSVDVNPAAAIVGALIGGTLLGFVGALLAVPATAAIQLILREVLVPRQDAQ